MKFTSINKNSRMSPAWTYANNGITNNHKVNSMTKIAPAFIAAKKAFSPALKDKTNPAFRSKYADLGACLEAVNDSLLANGIAVIQETFDCESGITVETVLLHESGETIRSGKLHVPAVKNDPQGYGSALTYARRYSLMAVCGIAPEDDDGNAASKTVAKPQAKPQPAKNFDAEIAQLKACKTMDELASVWKSLEAGAKHVLLDVKDAQKQAIDEGAAS